MFSVVITRQLTLKMILGPLADEERLLTDTAFRVSKKLCVTCNLCCTFFSERLLNKEATLPDAYRSISTQGGKRHKRNLAEFSEFTHITIFRIKFTFSVVQGIDNMENLLTCVNYLAKSPIYTELSIRS
jgi:hypothetical protein